MSTTTKPAKADALAAFDAAYAAATHATSDLRSAYTAAAEAERAVVLAEAEQREADRLAIVTGRDSVTMEALSDARTALDAARARVDEMKAEDADRQAALARAVQSLVDAGGKDALGIVIRSLIDAADQRLELAVDELAAGRRQLAQTLGLLSWLHGKALAVVPEAAVLSRIDLPRPNGDPYDWREVEASLRRMAATARSELSLFVALPEQRAQRVSREDILRWHVANGGSFSDPAGLVDAKYLEQGPRREEYLKDLEEQKAVAKATDEALAAHGRERRMREQVPVA